MQSERPIIERWLSQDIDELSGLLHGWEQEFRQLSCGGFVGQVCTVRGSGMAIAAERTNQSLHEEVTPPPGSVVFGLVLNRDDALQVNRRPVGTSSLLVLEGGREYDFRTSGATELLGVSMPREQFAATAQGSGAALLRDALAQGVVPLDTSAIAMLRQFWFMLSRILEAHDTWPDTMPLGLLAETAMNNVVLALTMSASMRPTQLPPAAERETRVVQQAIRFMSRHLGQDISIDDVCAATHVSRRTLQYHFDHALHVSPLQYLKVLRLNAARRLLRDGPSTTSIAEIAARCGYEHASRFAGDYKRQFGMLPSEVVRAGQPAPHSW